MFWSNVRSSEITKLISSTNNRIGAPVQRYMQPFVEKIQMERRGEQQTARSSLCSKHRQQRGVAMATVVMRKRDRSPVDGTGLTAVTGRGPLVSTLSFVCLPRERSAEQPLQHKLLLHNLYRSSVCLHVCACVCPQTQMSWSDFQSNQRHSSEPWSMCMWQDEEELSIILTCAECLLTTCKWASLFCLPSTTRLTHTFTLRTFPSSCRNNLKLNFAASPTWHAGFHEFVAVHVKMSFLTQNVSHSVTTANYGADSLIISKTI